MEQDVFSKWYQKRKLAASKKVWQRGFNWAAGQLLEFDNEDYLKSRIQYAKDFCSYDDFDKGIGDALVKYYELKEMSSQDMLGKIFKHG